MGTKKKLETSKILLIIVCIISFILTCAVLYIWFTEDKMDTPAILGIVTSPAITVIGFYSWKAKNENLIKIREYMKCNNLTNSDILGAVNSEETNLQDNTEEDSLVEK